MKYGLWDSQDNLWMGDSAGPKTYDELDIAVIAARVCDARLAWRAGRTIAREYVEAPRRLRDSLDAKMTALAALAGIESGEL